MSLIKWDASFSVGHETIDQQHQQLLSIVNQFFDALKQGQATAVQRQVLEKLIEYTREHFTYEEGVMLRADYPDLTDHQNQHRAMIARVNEFVKAYNSGSTAKHPQMMQFLRSWLLDHIKQSDKAYMPYLAGTRV